MHRDRRVPGHAGFPTVTGGCLMMVDRSTGTPHFQPGSQQLIAGIIAHMERTAKIPNPFCIPAFSVPLENIKSWDCREHKIELGVKKACRYAAGLFIGANYSSISITTPEPTVRPFPIWLAKWEPCLFHWRRRSEFALAPSILLRKMACTVLRTTPRCGVPGGRRILKQKRPAA